MAMGDQDAFLVYCPACKRAFFEEVAYDAPGLSDPVEEPDRIIVKRVEFKQNNTYSYSLGLHFIYVKDGRLFQDATVLGTSELDTFQALSEEDQWGYIRALARKEWRSHVRAERMKLRVESLNIPVGSFWMRDVESREKLDLLEMAEEYGDESIIESRMLPPEAWNTPPSG
jgi:hypothetical protein